MSLDLFEGQRICYAFTKGSVPLTRSLSQSKAFPELVFGLMKVFSI